MGLNSTSKFVMRIGFNAALKHHFDPGLRLKSTCHVLES